MKESKFEEMREKLENDLDERINIKLKGHHCNKIKLGGKRL